MAPFRSSSPPFPLFWTDTLAARPLPDLGQDVQAGLQIPCRDGCQQFVAQVARGVLDLLEKRARLGLQVNGFAAAIVLRVFALDPAARFRGG